MAVQRDARFPITAWIRRCDECGNVQEEKHPPTYGTEPSRAYCDRKCKRCQSQALEYGMPNSIDEDYE